MLTDRELQTMRNLGGFSEDAADEIAALRAEVAALTENGPPMQRGTTIEGTPWMGTMREVLEDYKSAADTEARWGDEARAEIAGLREALANIIEKRDTYGWSPEADAAIDAARKGTT